MSYNIKVVHQKLNEIIEVANAAQTWLTEIETDLIRANDAVSAAQAQAAAAAGPTLIQRIMPMLDGEWKLRTMQAVQGAVNAGREEILDALDDAGISAVLMRRRGDGAELIGLASRND